MGQGVSIVVWGESSFRNRDIRGLVPLDVIQNSFLDMTYRV